MQFLRRRAKTAIARHGVNHFKRVFRPHNLPTKILNSLDKY
ncbi:hypothetical protein LTSEWAN_2874 [Salmonella enterica subsp. enterica serovar Wandsworth str. A4-580]|uniref:Uncharacterized protein n=3 Tax=Salmonella enterica I TaxID=59201 RepID=A0A6C6Z1Q4_SALPB|nr:hypothetical protein SPAB_01895 [Salmonella enterica subsp. enterica serovar Paratyphi B str. SPB7]EHC91655.1 hypothetical protein LTSEUGA_2554 [Salmonella enterica subsp. enterica serovar Uganda str. R8-3404]EHD02690.1 hypothetical protein LTSEWAN_2874 [Salmonella enterica subsp. enterica serovar Wandsworth str. A4-580]